MTMEMPTPCAACGEIHELNSLRMCRECGAYDVLRCRDCHRVHDVEHDAENQVVPEQPPGIDPDNPDDHTLPPVAEVAARVNEYLSQWGDGLIDTAAGNTPLYARDLQALTNSVTGRNRG